MGAEIPLPPPDEVVTLWANGIPLLDAPAAAAWLREAPRGINPQAVARLDLARVVPRGLPLPIWAGFWDNLRPAILVPAFDAQGRLVTIRALSQGEGPRGDRTWAASGYGIKGTVLACPVAVMLLQTGELPLAEGPFDVLIAVGEPSFLLEATRRGTTGPRPAVLGVYQGGWTEAIAVRIPDGVRVCIALHTNRANSNLANQVRDSLSDRCQVVVAE